MDLFSYPTFFHLLSISSLSLSSSPSLFLSLLHRALGILMFKGILFVMFLMYPLPGKDLKWKRAPSLPMQELNRKFGQGSSKGGGSGSQDRPRMPPRPPPPQPPGKSSRVTSSSSREKIPSHHEEVTTYSITSPNFPLSFSFTSLNLFLLFLPIHPFQPPFSHTLSLHFFPIQKTWNVSKNLQRIPMESFAMEEEIKPMRVGGTRYPREIRVPFGTVV